MDIKFDESVIQDQIQRSANDSLKKAFEGYEVRRAIEKSIADTVIYDALQQAITNAVDKIDLQNLTNELAKQIQKTMVSSTITMLKEQSVEIIFRMRKKDFMTTDEEKHVKEEIRQQIKGK